MNDQPKEVILQAYIDHLEQELKKAGWVKICSCCELIGHPIWSCMHPAPRCELCQEEEK